MKKSILKLIVGAIIVVGAYFLIANFYSLNAFVYDMSNINGIVSGNALPYGLQVKKLQAEQDISSNTIVVPPKTDYIQYNVANSYTPPGYTQKVIGETVPGYKCVNNVITYDKNVGPQDNTNTNSGSQNLGNQVMNEVYRDGEAVKNSVNNAITKISDKISSELDGSKKDTNNNATNNNNNNNNTANNNTNNNIADNNTSSNQNLGNTKNTQTSNTKDSNTSSSNTSSSNTTVNIPKSTTSQNDEKSQVKENTTQSKESSSKAVQKDSIDANTTVTSKTVESGN